MPELNEKELKAHLKGEVPYPVYLICGDEDYLKKLYTDMLISKIVPDDFESFNLDRFNSKNLDLRDVFDKAETMPMMAERRCIVVENCKLDSMNEADFNLLSSYCSNPCDFSSVIFHQKNSDFSISKAKKAATVISKVGAVCVLNKRTGTDLIKPLISSAKKHGCVLSTQMANYLVSLVGDDFNTLINELSKVCNFCGEGEITKKHIDEVAVKNDDAKIYLLTKALIGGDFDKAFEVLHILLRQKTEPEYILGTLVSTYVDMYRAKISLANCERAEALSEPFKYGKLEFRLTNGGRDASKMSIETLRLCLEELSKADMKLKNGRDLPMVVLEQLMVRLFLIRSGERV